MVTNKCNKVKQTCGIYKITSPSGRTYIGESQTIEKRWKSYRQMNCKKQRKLYHSLKKYGVENHTFEIIEECEFDELKCRERYWQDFYDVLDKGLNCKLTECGEKKQVHSKETLEKMRNNMLGSKNPMFGKKTQKKEKIFKEPKSRGRGNNSNAELVLCLSTGIFFDCAVDAADAFNINSKYLQKMLRNKSQNKTSLIYVKNYFEGITVPVVTKYERECKAVIDVTTNIIYKSTKEVSKIFNINLSTLKSKLNGGLKNNTNFKYLDNVLQ